MEVVQCLDFLAGSIHNTLVNGIRYTVIDQLGQHETVLTMIEHLEGIGGEREQVSNIRVAGKNRIDVTSESCALVLIDRVRGVGRVPLHCNPTSASSSDTWLRAMRDRRFTTSGHALLCGRGVAEAGNKLARCSVSYAYFVASVRMQHTST